MLKVRFVLKGSHDGELDAQQALIREWDLAAEALTRVMKLNHWTLAPGDSIEIHLVP